MAHVYVVHYVDAATLDRRMRHYTRIWRRTAARTGVAALIIAPVFTKTWERLSAEILRSPPGKHWGRSSARGANNFQPRLFRWSRPLRAPQRSKSAYSAA